MREIGTATKHDYTNAQMVRVPRNIINLQTSFQLPKDENLKFVFLRSII